MESVYEQDRNMQRSSLHPARVEDTRILLSNKHIYSRTPETVVSLINRIDLNK